MVIGPLGDVISPRALLHLSGIRDIILLIHRHDPQYFRGLRGGFMNVRKVSAVLSVLLLLSTFAAVATPQEKGKGAMVAHMVYFDLKDSSAAARAKLVSDCHKYLRKHPGVVFFAAGTMADDFNRDVNVRDFHVSLHLVFKTKADHDRYSTAPAHLQFIKENSANWARVRVFDSYVE
jgi:hypothetical protein